MVFVFASDLEFDLDLALSWSCTLAGPRFPLEFRGSWLIKADAESSFEPSMGYVEDLSFSFESDGWSLKISNM